VFVDSAEALGQSPISAVIGPDAGRPADPQEVRPRDARVARRRLVQHAVEFLSSHAAEGVRIGELSRVAGVSERTLRKAFHTVHGLSPKQFDLRQRLFGARRALCHVDATRKTVTTIACEFGFFELGRFSRAYKAAFGESPSQTIKTHTAVARGAW
jgi:transcriptional regulator GlxA family with amidase domain